MNPARVDTKKLRSAVTLAVKEARRGSGCTRPIPRRPTRCGASHRPACAKRRPSAARKPAIESDEHGDVVEATEYDAKAVIEDLDNVETLAALAAPLARLQRMLDDSRLLWLAEAYVPSLELYGVAKVHAKKDGTLAQAIAPLVEVFAMPRKRRASTPESDGQ
jgi:hypothetical protein